MQIKFLLWLTLFIATQSNAQSHFSKKHLSINGFRNPSIGLEYNHHQISLNAGYYITNFTSGVTTHFVKTGLSLWFLPFDTKEIPSSFYAGASYLCGLDKDYKDKSTFGLEAGFRWYIWNGLNIRLGIIALASRRKDLKVNPTPGINYSIIF